MAFPSHWNTISDVDREEYLKLRGKWPNFQDFLKAVKSYVYRSEFDIYKRAIVCGITWNTVGIAINISQLLFLFLRSKSTIWFALKNMGYTPIRNPCELEFLPYPERRQWVLFQKEEVQPKHEEVSFYAESPAPDIHNDGEFIVSTDGHDSSIFDDPFCFLGDTQITFKDFFPDKLNVV